MFGEVGQIGLTVRPHVAEERNLSTEKSAPMHYMVACPVQEKIYWLRTAIQTKNAMIEKVCFPILSINISEYYENNIHIV